MVDLPEADPRLGGAEVRDGVSRECDAASERFRFEQPQLGALETVGEEPTAAALNDGIDEHPVLVDQIGFDQGVA